MHAVVHINHNIDNALISAWQHLSKPDKIYLACVGPQNPSSLMPKTVPSIFV
jgi:hypothetical protein